MLLTATMREVDNWVRQRERLLIAVLVAAALVLRALLVIHSPTAFGYVWDFYADGIKVVYEQGRLPVAADCWICYHPPLFFVTGVPFYAFGMSVGGSESAALRWTGALSMIAAAVTIYYGYRMLRLYRCRGVCLVVATSILLVFPCLFISSYGAEADILLTALLSAFVFYLARASARPRLISTTDAIRLGLVAGLAASTKASGLAGIVTIGLVSLAALLFRTDRIRVARLAVITLLVSVPLGGWKYLADWRTHGTPFHARGTASQGFSLGSRSEWGRPFEFATFRLGALRRAIGPNIRTGMTLTDLEVYDSVPTTLHALAWSDMSMFSVTSRHGSAEMPYPWKTIPPTLTLTVILLGFVPTILALVGLAASMQRTRLLPLAAFGVVSLAAYVWWFLPQPTWSLKTKYILFLLPQYVLYLSIGLGWFARRIPAMAFVIGAALAVLIALCHLYNYAFAVGGL